MVNSLLNNFKNKRVFITGHTGFKGSWLSYWLYKSGAIVKGLSLAPNTSPNLFENLQIDKLFASVIGNINHQSFLQKEIVNFEPDYIFHLAAQPLVRRSYKDPLETFQTNIIGTANVLQSLRFVEKPCICICITTDKVYLNNESEYAYKEYDRLGGYDPYSASKASAELIISSYRNSFFNVENFDQHQKSIASVRAGNVIGGGDWSEDRLIPDIVKSLYENKEIIIRNPDARRPWQHVMEPLLGYMQLAFQLSKEVKTYSGAWNFGPRIYDNFSVEEVANIAISTWGSGKIIIEKDKSSPHEAQQLRLDISKANSALKWFPKLNAKQAIEKTINWYRGFYSGKSAVDLVDEDLKFYKTAFN